MTAKIRREKFENDVSKYPTRERRRRNRNAEREGKMLKITETKCERIKRYKYRGINECGTLTFTHLLDL